ncbi:MAG TPA: diacylglycerol kinase family protein [Gaiellaceae bacterium]|nr:diacylglycerol kinase family protein [Gaiellaceae bacterium]
MQTTLIVNPYASRVTEALTAEVARALGADRVLRTERAGHAVELAAEVEEGSLVVFSGDGGFNEVLNGVRPGVRVGFVPGGGTSVLPRALGLPRDPLAAARAVAAGRIRRISLGRANGRRFAFSAGVGLDAELVRRMDARGRDATGKRPGDLAFVATALRTLAERRARIDPQLELIGHGRVAFALVANGDPYTFAGPLPLHVTPHAVWEGGLDAVGPARVRARTLPRFVAYAVSGRGLDRARDLVRVHDVDTLELRCDRPLPLQVDGEDLGDVIEVRFECERAAVDVLVP